MERFLLAARASFRRNIGLFYCLLTGFALSVIIEIMARSSFSSFIRAFLERPTALLQSTLIITTCLVPCMFFRRKVFYTAVVSALWLGLGIANFCVLGFRTSPLSAIDFVILKDLDWSFIGIYVSIPAFILLVLSVFLLIAGLVLLFRKCPKTPRLLLRGAVSLSAVLLAVSLLPELPAPFGFTENSNDILVLNERYGFVYAFSRSAFDRGINRPEDYSAQRIRGILRDELNAPSQMPEELPNILFLQLESFFDVNHLEGVEFSENPVPYFQELCDKYPSGFFTAPSVGAGTANTEFEVLTQMNVHHFGAGEYPYITILQETTSESLAYIFSRWGLLTHVIHDNTATFYDRNVVFPQLGFDSFTSVEYMRDVEYNEIGWARDKVLTDEIVEVLDSVEDSYDFIYTISVQPHGAYPENSENAIRILSGVENETLKGQLEYYAYQLHEVDDFLRDLTAALDARGEPTVLVVYGDHMPALDLEQSKLDKGNLYTTEYAIWSNIPGLQEAEDKDVHAYQLASRVMEILGMNQGTLTKFHQMREWSGAYETELATLQYDMLYGDHIVYGGENPFEPSKMRMGTTDILLLSAQVRGHTVTVTGERFTPYSVIYIDGEPQETTFISETEITCKVEDLGDNARISVWQVSEDGTLLSSAVSRPTDNTE